MIFGAGDLGVNAAGRPLLIRRSTDVNAFTSYAALNTSTGGGVSELTGPGVVSSPKIIDFSKVGRYYYNITTPSPNIGQPTKDTATLGISWGSFTGGNNPIVAYPEGTSVRALEALVKRGL
jgi:hypothetical protein